MSRIKIEFSGLRPDHACTQGKDLPAVWQVFSFLFETWRFGFD
jgi:hypothetical protein